MRIVYLIPFMAALSLPAQAADGGGAFAVKGAGAETCAAYMAARERNPGVHAMFVGWLEGYLTGLNELSPGVFDIAFWRERGVLSGLVYVNCRDNPEQRFAIVARAMAKQLAESPLAESSPLIEARIGERGVPLYRATLQKVEEALSARGIDPGEIDGRWDEAASRGVLLFQRGEETLTPTGLPDQATLARLLGLAP